MLTKFAAHAALLLNSFVSPYHDVKELFATSSVAIVENKGVEPLTSRMQI